MIGHRLAHFELRELVGAGGMGEVYRAHDEHLNRDVAVKVLPQGFLTDEAARRRFRTEALALSKLNHPSIATVFDFDSQNGVDFLVMELVQGHPLSIRPPGQPLDEGDVIRLGLQLADGLVAAHTQGIVHRDLKPGNLMTTSDGRLKILDFGLATVASTDGGDITRTQSRSAVEGTVPYMSPEQLCGLAADPRSDVYAAGAVLYELLTGSRPHPEVQSNELIGAILHQPVEPPRTRNNNISLGLERIVMRALEKQPDHRYQSARELYLALDQLNAEVAPGDVRRVKRMLFGSLGWVVLLVLAVAAAFGLPTLKHLLPATSQSRSAVAPAQPPRDAGRLYIAGLDRLRAYDLVGARDVLQKAVVANPDHALAHSALSRAWWTSGFTERAKAEARRAFELSPILPREDRLAIEGQFRSTIGEHDKAIDCYRTLLNLVPANVEYGLWLAAAQTDARKGRDALATLEALRRLPPANADPRIDLLEASAASSIDDYAHMRAAAERVVATVQSRSSKQLSAYGQLTRAKALFALNDPNQAIVAYDSARTIFAAEGDRAGEATALSAAAQVVWGRGDLTAAEDMFKEALAIHRSVDHKDGIAAALMNLGRVRYIQNDLVPARRFIEESLQIRRTLGDRRGIAECLNGIALVLQDQHDLASARKVHAHALVIRRELADRPGIAQTLYNMALLLGAESNLADAKRMHQEALAIRRELGDKSRTALSIRQLSGILTTQGELRDAQTGLEEALQSQLALGEKGQAAYTRIDLAGVLTELGWPDRAEPVARLAVAEFRSEKAPDGEAEALRALAEAQLAQKKLDDARGSIDDALRILDAIDPQSPRLETRIVAARIDAASGKIDDARKALESAASTASRLKLRGNEFEARLALGEVDVQSGNASAARARLATLQKEAAERGFLLLAGKADTLLQRLGKSR